MNLSWVRRLLLSLFLVLGQAGAAAHAVGHLFEDLQDQAPHSHQVCGQCIAYAHLGAVLPSLGLAVAGSAPAMAPPPPVGLVVAISRWTPVYRSRAPPSRSRTT